MYQKIQHLCKENGITIAELEKVLGFGAATIWRWQTSSPTIGKLKPVADYFGVTVDELLKESN